MDAESRGLGRAEGGLVLELLDSRYIPRVYGAASDASTPCFDLTSISLGVFIGLKRLPPWPVFRVRAHGG